MIILRIIIFRRLKNTTKKPTSSSSQILILHQTLQQFFCPVCFENVPKEDTVGLNCGHMYCKSCWVGYLDDQIQTHAANAITTRCMYPKCLQVVTQDMYKKFLTKEKYERYEYFFLKSCVEQNPKYTFCPKDCGTVVQYLDFGKPTKSVSCSCGCYFCFLCGQEKHDPVSCQELKRWLQKESSEEDAIKLIEATSKQCPHCLHHVTRTQGCNHMRCRCGKDWCWMCRKDWAPHNQSWYSCFQYSESDAKKKDEEAEMLKAELDRYTAFYNRYQDHRKTGIDAENKRGQIRKASQQFQQSTNFESSFLEEALDLLISCRHTLKYFYVYQFYHDKEQLSDLTIEQRNLAEHYTEQLADYIFAPKIDRDKIKNHISVTRKYLRGLVESILDRVES